VPLHGCPYRVAILCLCNLWFIDLPQWL